MAEMEESERREFDLGLLQQLQLDQVEMGVRYGSNATTDMMFLAYLQRMSRFGFFSYGPVMIDVRIIEDIVERMEMTSPAEGLPVYSDDYVQFTRVLMDEGRRSGRRRLDELHFLLAFMRFGEGLPARVFGELGITPGQVEQYAKNRGREDGTLEKLYSPEEVAEYLGVHVQTVRTWIRTGRLPARRLAGQRALRVRASDIQGVLEPVDPRAETGQPTPPGRD